MIVTNRRDNCSAEGLPFKRPSSRSASHSPASSRCGMRCNTSRLVRGAAGEQLQNGLRHPCYKVAVLFPASQLILLRPGRALWSIGLAFFFCALKRRYLDQNTLAFVTATGSAEANNHRRKAAVLFGTTRKGGITSGEVLQMIEISTA